jgi:hypothetical protein
MTVEYNWDVFTTDKGNSGENRINFDPNFLKLCSMKFDNVMSQRYNPKPEITIQLYQWIS